MARKLKKNKDIKYVTIHFPLLPKNYTKEQAIANSLNKWYLIQNLIYDGEVPCGLCSAMKSGVIKPNECLNKICVPNEMRCCPEWANVATSIDGMIKKLWSCEKNIISL